MDNASLTELKVLVATGFATLNTKFDALTARQDASEEELIKAQEEIKDLTKKVNIFTGIGLAVSVIFSTIGAWALGLFGGNGV